MSKINNKWSNAEKGLLLHFVIDGIQRGEKIVELQAQFADTYMISKASVSNAWQGLAKENELMVASAKATWKNWGLPEKVAAEKEAKAEAKLQERVRKQTIKSRADWRKKKAKLESQRAKMSFPTGMEAKPSDRGMYVQIDAHGVVTRVKAQA